MRVDDGTGRRAERMVGRSHADLAALRARVRGQVLAPGDAGYDERRVIELGNYDERPAAVVAVDGADDVVAALRFAAGRGWPVAVRSGGHSTAGFGSVDGGLVVNMRGLDQVVVDVAAGTATAGAGVTAGAFARALAEHDLVVGLGDTATVGVSGLTLGGGLGLLSRRLGLTVDALRSAEVVTVDGAVRQVDATREPDLFWALRGGGANVGVVTRLTFRTAHLPTLLSATLTFPLTAPVLRHVIDVAAAASRDASVIVNTMIAPPAPFVPAALHGKPVAMVLVAHTGSDADARAFVDALRSAGAPLAETVQRLPYAATLHDVGGDGPPVRPIAAAGTYFADDVPDAALDRVVEWVTTAPAAMSVVQLRPLGGAIADVPDDATAYAHRTAPFVAYVAAMGASLDDQVAREAAVDALLDGMPGRRPGAYVNFLARTGSGGASAAYPAPTWARLAEVKQRYDPGNVLRVNHNVPPADPLPAPDSAA